MCGISLMISFGLFCSVSPFCTEIHKTRPLSDFSILNICLSAQEKENLYFFCSLPVQYLVPTFLTRAVLYAGKEAWKRRPFLLSSQICSNYRITSICGSLAAFWLPPPPFSSPLLSLSLSPLSFAFSPIALFFPAFIFLFYFWLFFVHSEHFLFSP